MINVSHESAMDLMAKYEDKHFELAIVDVNYGIGEDGSGNKSRSKLAKSKDYVPYHGNDIESPPIEYFKELFRVSQNQIIWGANHFISKIPYDSPGWIVWDKDNGNNDFADCELAWTSFDRAVRKVKYKWHGMLQQDMKNKELRIHPNQKPIYLYKWLLTNYANVGDKILDTHLGSMSICIAAIEMGFDLTGCELSEKYYNDGKQRILNHVAQLNAFQESPVLNFNP